MIYLTLGIIIGILLCFFIVCIEFWLKKTILNRIERKVQGLRREKGAIISIPSDEERIVNEIIQKNEELGKDTSINEINEE